MKAFFNKFIPGFLVMVFYIMNSGQKAAKWGQRQSPLYNAPQSLGPPERSWGIYLHTREVFGIDNVVLWYVFYIYLSVSLDI